MEEDATLTKEEVVESDNKVKVRKKGQFEPLERTLS